MALSLNYFNLLPFTPLDGGQIVDTFLFARRPRLRFGFFLLSIGALFAVAYALDSTPLAGAALLLALGISGGWPLHAFAQRPEGRGSRRRFAQRAA